MTSEYLAQLVYFRKMNVKIVAAMAVKEMDTPK